MSTLEKFAAWSIILAIGIPAITSLLGSVGAPSPSSYAIRSERGRPPAAPTGSTFPV